MSEAVDAMREWAAKPVVFVREVLGAVLDDWQVEVLEAVAARQRVALKASKGPGKSTVLAWVALWFLATRPHPKVVATSITGDNLRDGLWTEIAKWLGRSEFLRASFEWTSERVASVEHPETWWASARTWPRSGDASQQADTLAGLHADHVLFLVDEAGGIPDAVVAAAEAGLANASEEHGREAKLLLAGNPTHLEGPLYRACTSERPLWWVKEISGDPDDPQRAPRVSAEWAREQISKYGRDNPWVLVNVFGKFPPSSANTLLGVEEVEAATKRMLPRGTWEDEPKVLGIDVARYGDDRSVLFPRQGFAAMQPTVLRNLSTMELVGQAARLIDRWRPDAVFVDSATFGAGVIDRLLQLGYPVLGVDFGGKPVTAGKFANRRAEMYFALAEWVRAGGALPSGHPELTAELTAPTYKFDNANHLLLEKKAEVKKRTGRSPDLADGLALTFAAPVAPRDLRHLAQAGRRAITEYELFTDGSAP